MEDESLLAHLLAPGSLRPVFQPIVEVNASLPTIHGWEGLIRGPAGTNVEGADVLFDYVRRKHAEAPMDRRCVETILDAAAKSCVKETRVAVNVHASTLGRDSDFVNWMIGIASALRLDFRHVTVEVVEHAPACNSPLFHTALEKVRNAGAAVALDDVGLGQSNFRMILDVKPDIFKIDRHIASGCTADPHRQAVLESIVGLAGRFGGRVVAEGIETIDELRTIRELGVALVQGFLFSPPRKTTELDPIASVAAWRSLLEASRPTVSRSTPPAEFSVRLNERPGSRQHSRHLSVLDGANRPTIDES